MMQRKLSANKGFSLVELIIVIAIMAVLTALLAPQFLKYVEKSRLARDEQNIEEIYRAMQVALTDEKAYAALTTYCEANSGGYYLHIRNSTEITNRGMVVQGTASNKTTLAPITDIYNAIVECVADTHIANEAVIFPLRFRFSSRKYIDLMTNAHPALTLIITLDSEGELVTKRINTP